MTKKIETKIQEIIDEACDKCEYNTDGGESLFLENQVKDIVKKAIEAIWHDRKEPLPIGEIAIIRYNSIVIGWANDTHDGIEDEHGRLITKDFTKWALVKDLI